MTPGIFTRTERELRKHLNLSNSRITRTGKCLRILCSGKRGPQAAERCFTLGLDGGWEVTGYPRSGDQARILVNASPDRGEGGLSARRIQAIARALRMDGMAIRGNK